MSNKEISLNWEEAAKARGIEFGFLVDTLKVVIKLHISEAVGNGEL